MATSNKIIANCVLAVAILSDIVVCFSPLIIRYRQFSFSTQKPKKSNFEISRRFMITTTTTTTTTTISTRTTSTADNGINPNRLIFNKRLLKTRNNNTPYDNSPTALTMCQLLGMNCATPTDFTFSFSGFARRGGDTDKHSDGWGLAFYEGRGVRCFHDPLPAARSPIAAFMVEYPIKTFNMIAHIRYATEGAVCLENVHPFYREMWGIQWCFAHNGDVPIFSENRAPWIGDDEPGERVYNPVGDTDSEALFCALLNALKKRFQTLPTLPVLYDTINSLCREIVQADESSILNFLMMCGEHVQFAYSWPGARPGSEVWNGLYYTIREPPFRQAQLADCDYAVDFAEVTTESDRVAVIATFPLTTNEEWIEFEKGELILFDDGLAYTKAADCSQCELQGHGLKSRVLPASVYMGECI